MKILNWINGSNGLMQNVFIKFMECGHEGFVIFFNLYIKKWIDIIMDCLIYVEKLDVSKKWFIIKNNESLGVCSVSKNAAHLKEDIKEEDDDDDDDDDIDIKLNINDEDDKDIEDIDYKKRYFVEFFYKKNIPFNHTVPGYALIKVFFYFILFFFLYIYFVYKTIVLIYNIYNFFFF